MFARERLDLIKDRLKRDGKVVANNLAIEFEVSEDTIRRDLRDLAKIGICRKVYGGAILSISSLDAPQFGSITNRASIEPAEKYRLAKVAAGLVKPSQTILIDAGTTNIAIANALPRDMPLTVVTNAPAILDALNEHKRVNIILLGGFFDRDKGACLGAVTLSELERIHADLFFLGACGVDGTIGVTAFDHAEADVKRAMIKSSAHLAVAATHDKIPAIAPFQVARAQDLKHLIVEDDTDPELLTPFRLHGTHIHCVNDSV